jgi:hypothetical protein
MAALFEELLQFVTSGIRLDRLSRKTLFSYRTACNQMISVGLKKATEKKSYPGAGRGMSGNTTFYLNDLSIYIYIYIYFNYLFFKC